MAGDEKYLTKIAALLRQAESTDNAHEAEAFMAAAQRLATATSIDLAVARAHTAKAERRTAPVAKRIEIGEAGKRGLRTYVQLFLAVGLTNDLKCDIARNSTYVIAYGFPSDIDVSEALYASLVIQMVRASDLYLRSGAYRDETVLVRERNERGRLVTVRKAVHGTTARVSFQLAFAARIGERLQQARAAEVREITARDSASTGTALALTEKALEVTEAYQQLSTARGSWSGYSSSGRTSQSAARAGRRAADSARLGGAPELPAGRRQVGA
ncbi:DUF2786 domain-containing protein [Jatrophihabitans sp.]|uniref:DUF2786 domain-containing protein n=1 Tax=Jatrophihabitans sp. TaxID=1932789 RepID=UPI0030C685F1|nr:hypothetical protein [Jatrophihabitans sp.]